MKKHYSFLLLIFTFFLAKWNYSNTYYVTTTLDAGPGSLRQAVINANTNFGPDMIDFSFSTYPATISLTSGHITITEDLSIMGPGIDSVTITSNYTSRVFMNGNTPGSTPELFIDGLTFANNQDVGSGFGNCIFNNGNLIIQFCKFTGNTGSAGGGAIMTYSYLSVYGCTFTNNNCAGAGAGVLILSTPQASLTNCTFTNNSTQSPGAAVFINSSVVSIDGCTFSNNTVQGGSYPGGAIGSQEASFSVTNSTFSGNSAVNGAAISLNDYGANAAQAYFTNLTIADNVGGSAIYQLNSGGTTSITASNCIFKNSNNYASAGGLSAFTSNGSNISSDASMITFLIAAGDMNNTDPKLLPLANNGGPTMTRALKCGSPAVNAGNAFALTSDQRGVARVGGADIGSYELNPLFLPSATSQSVTICNGDNFSIGVHTYNASGIYHDTLSATGGCDSVVTTNLTVLNANINNLTASICQGDSILIAGQYQFSAGSYNDTLTAANGCDSVVITTLSINALPNVSLALNPSTVCVNDGSYSLSGGSPAGGVYAGTSVSSGNFDPTAAGIGQYYITYTYTDGNNCTNTDSMQIIVDACLGISQSVATEFIKIFPNPVRSTSIIQTNQNIQDIQLQIVNCTGQIVGQVKKLNSNTFQFNRENLPSGMYFIQLSKQDRTIATEKFIISDY